MLMLFVLIVLTVKDVPSIESVGRETEFEQNKYCYIENCLQRKLLNHAFLIVLFGKHKTSNTNIWF